MKLVLLRDLCAFYVSLPLMHQALVHPALVHSGSHY
jgi:hypothetical protein